VTFPSFGLVEADAAATCSDFQERYHSMRSPEQLTFRLQPIIDIVSISATALNVNFACTQFNFFTRGMCFDLSTSLRNWGGFH
jgi:hypothetical protein